MMGDIVLISSIGLPPLEPDQGPLTAKGKLQLLAPN